MGTKQKTRWVDGTTDPYPCTFVSRDECIRLGITLENDSFVGTLVDNTELALLRYHESIRKNNTPTQNETWVPYRVLVVLVVGYHVVLVWVWVYHVGK